MYGGGRIPPLILNLDTRGKWVIGFTPRTLESLVPLEAEDPKGRSEGGDEENKSQPLLGIELQFPGLLCRSLVTIVTCHLKIRIIWTKARQLVRNG
jgi:hypothetical protein